MLPIKTFDSFAKGIFYDIWNPQEEGIVLGRFSPMTDIKSHCMGQIPIIRRVGGGGTVLLNSGALIVDIGVYRQAKMTIADYFVWFNSTIVQILQQQNMMASFDKKSFDLIVEDKKIGGVSLALRKNLVLYGVSLIIQDSLIRRIQEVLTLPPLQPSYRNNRQHVDFLKSLSSFPHFDQTTLMQNLQKGLTSFMQEHKMFCNTKQREIKT